MNNTSGFHEGRSSTFRSLSYQYRFPHEQRHQFGTGSRHFSMLTISSLSPQASAQSEKMSLTPFSYPPQKLGGNNAHCN
jgi:hypothetical protein